MATTRVDTRNLEWKNNNVGSKLLSAMGWTDGTKVGKRARMMMSSTTTTTAEATSLSPGGSHGVGVIPRVSDKEPIS